jgi:hypothetical protein
LKVEWTEEGMMPDNSRFRTRYEQLKEIADPRNMATISGGEYENREFSAAERSKIGTYLNTVHSFLRTGNEEVLDGFRDTGVTDTTGSFWAFECDENVLYELSESEETFDPYDDDPGEDW